MATKEMQTAAFAVVHVVQPTDRDVTALQNRFNLHPHDAEEILRVHTQNQLRPFQNYVFASLLWPMYRTDSKEIQSVEFNLVIGPSMLLMIDQHGSHVIEEFIDRLMSQPQSNAQSPLSLAAELLIHLAQQSERQADVFAGDVRTTIGDIDARQYGQGLLDLSDTLRELVTLPQFDHDSQGASLIRIASHRFQHRGQGLLHIQRSAAKVIPAPMVLSPKVVRGYAFVSAVTALVMIGWLIGH